MASPEEIAADLEHLRGKLSVKLLAVQGGEPFLNPRIIDIIKVIVHSGVGRQCFVLTNGKLLKRQPDDLWETMASLGVQLRISVYPDLDHDIVPYAGRKCSDYGIEFIPRYVYKFFAGFQQNDGSNYHGCIWNRCLTVHRGHFYLCPQSALFPQKYMNLPATIDGLPLRGLTEDRLREFLANDKPLNACRMCSGAKGEEHEWRQVKNEKDWNVASGLTFDPKSV